MRWMAHNDSYGRFSEFFWMIWSQSTPIFPGLRLNDLDVSFKGPNIKKIRTGSRFQTASIHWKYLEIKASSIWGFHIFMGLPRWMVCFADPRCVTIWQTWLENSLSGWWFGTWILFFHVIYGMSSFPLTNSIIFQKVIAPPTSLFIVDVPSHKPPLKRRCSVASCLRVRSCKVSIITFIGCKSSIKILGGGWVMSDDSVDRYIHNGV